MKITLPIATGDLRWPTVSAEIVDVAPHLANVASFAVHKQLCVRFFWTVTNIETGNSVCSTFTKDEATDEATRLLAEKTEEDFLAVYAACPKDCTT